MRRFISVSVPAGVLAGIVALAAPAHPQSGAPPGAWMPKAPMPAVVDGKIHVIGGRTLPTVPVTTHELFDPASGEWREAAPLPRARDHMATVAVGGKIHVIGGRLGGNTDHVAQHDVYDAATNSWSAGPPLPTSRSGVAGTFYRGLVLVLGGELPPGHTFVENEGYDPKTGRWVTLAPMPAGRHGLGVGVVGQDLYAVGGSLTPGGPGNTDQLIMFRLP
jgi:Kelch motif